MLGRHARALTSKHRALAWRAAALFSSGSRAGRGAPAQEAEEWLEEGARRSGPPRPADVTRERWNDLQNDGQWPVRVANIDPTLERRDVERLFAEFGLYPLDISAEYDPSTITVAAFYAIFRTKAESLEAVSLQGTVLGTKRVAMVEVSYRRMRALQGPFYKTSYGRYVLVDNVAEHTSIDDIHRHFEGYQLGLHPVSMIKEAVAGSQGLHALVRFDNATEAARAVRHLAGSFLLKNRVGMRVLL